jgi:hypothetical protein
MSTRDTPALSTWPPDGGAAARRFAGPRHPTGASPFGARVRGGKDLGPGREISVVDAAGVLRAVVVLPRPVRRFVVEGDRIFAVDDEGELRIFEVVR